MVDFKVIRNNLNMSLYLNKINTVQINKYMMTLLEAIYGV